MRQIIYLSLCVAFFAACGSAKKVSFIEKNGNRAAEEVASVGGSKDEHGCLIGAGQVWSELRQDCIQVFNVGTRLNPTEHKEGEAIISAFVVANDDKSKLELFLPDNSKKTIILNKVSDHVYQKGSYTYDAESESLSINGQVKYKGASGIPKK